MVEREPVHVIRAIRAGGWIEPIEPIMDSLRTPFKSVTACVVVLYVNDPTKTESQGAVIGSCQVAVMVAVTSVDHTGPCHVQVVVVLAPVAAANSFPELSPMYSL